MSFGFPRPDQATTSRSSTPGSNLFSSPSPSTQFGTPSQLTISQGSNQGTYGGPVAPPYMIDRSELRSTGHFQSIAAFDRYSRFSPEELRLADYKQDRAGEKGKQAAHNPLYGFPQPATKSTNPTMTNATRTDRSHLLLLRGAAIELRVGTAECSCAESAACLCINAWSLPKALISYYSPFLKAACQRDFQEKRENRITLPDDDPTVVGLFVEWMYYGSYTAPRPLLFAGDVNMDVKCWILGDKLLSVDFKNHAMKRIFHEYHGFFTSRTVSTEDMQFILENTGPKSKLRLFYIHYMIANWVSRERLKGTSQEWDELMLDHADARIALFESFRSVSERQSMIRNETYYLETDETVLKAVEKITIKG
ncbi:hypothetical protein FB567DRAFT_483936 [Paraphoma chrysanthemicola]|uniref:BTB domain-containing protein n=1 Tax=Paraphoma chrysanthemicola TaxID=798071 RepID=A0A8K0QTG2_9PLEO|nr:hypothetical protein FB567DRAFT_483936 [Paraphoma chrysanthemicola]